MHRSRHLPLLLLALAACHRPAEKAAAGGGLTILDPVGPRPTFFDLGRVPFGRKAEHVFRIRNDEGRTVTVQDLLPSCGCASARLTVDGKPGVTVSGSAANHDAAIEIPAGAIAELAVAIDTTQVQVMNKDKLATVRMRSDSGSTPYMTFDVHLFPERAMRAVPAEIELGQTPRSAGKSGRTTVSTEEATSRVQVLGIESVEGPFTATADSTDVAGERVWIVVATAKPGLAPGPVSGNVVLSVTGDDGTGTGPPFQIPVRAQIAEDVVLLPPVFLFGTFARGNGATKEVELDALVPGEKVKVTGTSVTTMPEGAAAEFAAEATPLDPDADGRASKWRIVLHASEKLAEGAFSGTLKIALDHPRVTEIRAAFSGVNGRAE
jgi:hypothetical protein